MRLNKTSSTRRRIRPAFSLVELVIVVTIIGTISAIAIPRISGAAGSSRTAALEATLASVRKTIDMYYAEHGDYPGYNPTNGTPSGTDFVKQLTMYSDADGYTNDAPTSRYRFGPYLRKPFPTNPTNKLNTVYVKATPAVADPANGSTGWVAVLSHGYFGISATDADLDRVGVKDLIVRDGIRGDAILSK